MRLSESISLLVKSLTNSVLSGGKPPDLKPRSDDFEQLRRQASARIERMRADAAQAKAKGNDALAEQITRELNDMQAQLDKAQKVYEGARSSAERVDAATQQKLADLGHAASAPSSATTATNATQTQAAPPPPTEPATEESFSEILARLRAASDQKP